MKGYDLDLQRELLWLSSKPWIRWPAQSEAITRVLSSQFALVFGSQRSGTTLMFLMLTAHPKITGLDENHAGFRLPPWPVIAVNALRGFRTVYKLPMMTGDVDKISRCFPTAQIVWMIRHPYAVVASMRNLVFPDGRSWIRRHGLEELRSAMGAFKMDAAPQDVPEDEIALGALIWRYKVETIDLYRERGMSVHTIRFEDLVVRTEKVMRKLTQDIGLPWSANVLQHHRFHGDERHAGGTRGNVAVDASRKARGDELSAAERSVVRQYIGPLMKRFDYSDGS